MFSSLGQYTLIWSRVCYRLLVVPLTSHKWTFDDRSGPNLHSRNERNDFKDDLVTFIWDFWSSQKKTCEYRSAPRWWPSHMDRWAVRCCCAVTVMWQQVRSVVAHASAPCWPSIPLQGRTRSISPATGTIMKLRVEEGGIHQGVGR